MDKELKAKLEEPFEGALLGVTRNGNPVQVAWWMDGKRRFEYVYRDFKPAAVKCSMNESFVSGGFHVMKECGGDDCTYLVFGNGWDVNGFDGRNLREYIRELEPYPDTTSILTSFVGVQEGYHLQVGIAMPDPKARERWQETRKSSLLPDYLSGDRQADIVRHHLARETGLAQEGAHTRPISFEKDLEPGRGYCINASNTTPPLVGVGELPDEPLEKLAKTVWSNLDKDRRTAVAAREMKGRHDVRYHLINR